jgi:transposase
MKKYIGCDMHNKYSVFVAVDENGRLDPAVKVSNDLLELRAYLATLPSGAPVAVEATRGWYWFVDELEATGLDARLVNPLEAKKRMAGNKKTDPRDAGSASATAKILQNGSWSNGVTFTVSTPHIIGISPTSGKRRARHARQPEWPGHQLE